MYPFARCTTLGEKQKVCNVVNWLQTSIMHRSMLVANSYYLDSASRQNLHYASNVFQSGQIGLRIFKIAWEVWEIQCCCKGIHCTALEQRLQYGCQTVMSNPFKVNNVQSSPPTCRQHCRSKHWYCDESNYTMEGRTYPLRGGEWELILMICFRIQKVLHLASTP